MVPREDNIVEHKEGISVLASPLSKLVTTATESKPLMIPYPVAIMSTTDLILRSDYKFDSPTGDNRPSSSQEDNDNNYMASSSPIGARSSATAIDEQVPRSMASRPRTTLAPEPSQYGTSPSQYATSPGSSQSAYASSPRSSSLAPDSQGNPIPLDAKWTRVKRSLISTEVLDQDKRRYEA